MSKDITEQEPVHWANYEEPPQTVYTAMSREERMWDAATIQLLLATASVELAIKQLKRLQRERPDSV